MATINMMKMETIDVPTLFLMVNTMDATRIVVLLVAISLIHQLIVFILVLIVVIRLFYLHKQVCCSSMVLVAIPVRTHF